jgi:twinkle protein
MLTESARKWLESRKIDPASAESLGVESVDRGTGDWIAFPVISKGKVVNRKYRRIDEKAFQQDKGGEKRVWNEDALREPEFTGPIIITEGEMDALAAIQAGYERVVSVPDGAPAEEVGDRESAKYSYVAGLIDLVRDAKEIIIAADGDGPGQNLLADLAPRLGKARCKYLTYPKGCKDLNDALIRFGVEGVEATMKRAAFVKVTGVCRFNELPPVPELTIWRPQLTLDLNRHMAICPQHFSVWTGIPGHGKSALLKAIGVELNRQYGVIPCIASFEDDIASDYRRDIAKYLAGRPVKDLQAEDWKKADEFLNENYVFINPDWDTEPTVEWLLERMETAAVRHGAKFFVVDPWTELEHRFHDMSETQYTSSAIALLRGFARRFNVHVAVVAHPTKLAPNRDGSLPIPNGYSVAGSAHWANKPELGVTVHRRRDDDGQEYALVRIWKSKRHDIMGPTGDVKMIFDVRTGQYTHYFAPDEIKDSRAA